MMGSLEGLLQPGVVDCVNQLWPRRQAEEQLLAKAAVQRPSRGVLHAEQMWTCLGHACNLRRVRQSGRRAVSGSCLQGTLLGAKGTAAARCLHGWS